MGHLLTAVIFPVILGIGLLASLQAKKKKEKKVNSVEFKAPVFKNQVSPGGKFFVHSLDEASKRVKKQPPVLIRLPKLAD